jgi:hypothetical protein
MSPASMLRRSLLAAFVVVLACNSLTGVDDLRVREGDELGNAGTVAFGNGGQGGNSGGSAGALPGTGGRGGTGQVAGGSGGGTPGVGGSMSAGGSGSLSAMNGAVSASCTSDADCLSGLSCALPDEIGIFGAGGPQGGYCTAQCSNGNDAECTRFDPLSVCGLNAGVDTPETTDDVYYCVEACQTGTATASELKCNSRPDLGCLDTDGMTTQGVREIGLCIPACQSDEGCDVALCDLASGLCVATDEEPAMGAPCADEGDCFGNPCITLTGAPQFCSGICPFGSLDGCLAFDPPREAACLDAYYVGGDFGDVGICAELCDVDAEPLDDRYGAGTAATFGRVGFCDYIDNPSVTLCSETCADSADDFCDDGGEDSDTAICDYGTDCTDCGPR